MNYLGGAMKNELLEIIKLSRLVVCSHNDNVKKVADKYNLSFAETDMLLVFSNNPNIINAKDVVNFSKVSKAYVSKSLNTLLEKKLISIQIDEIDKRKQKIIINKNANNIINDLKICEEKYLSNLTKNMKKQDIDLFIRLYQKIGNNIINRKEDINE